MKKTTIASAAAILLAGGFIATHEGLRLETYADPVHGWKVPTACYGQTGTHIRPGQAFTRDECKAMLDEETRRKATELDMCIKRDIPDHAAAAALSLAYNVGSRNVCRSTFVRMINQGAPPDVYCPQIGRWVFAGGRNCSDPKSNCRGIVTRRQEEVKLCLGQ